MKFCAACSMPIDRDEVFGAEINNNSFCLHCVDENKNVKTCEEIFEGGVQFFMSIDPAIARTFAEKIVRKNMKMLPYWQGKEYPCLAGETATDEEFQQILAKLQQS